MKPIFIIISLISMALFIGCSNDEKDTASSVSVGITDAPIDLDSLVLRVTEISVRSDSGSFKIIYSGSQSFNLLDFKNGSVKIFGNGDLEGSQVTEVRLKVDKAYAVKGAAKINITVPSGASSGLKLKVKNGAIEPGIGYTVVIDFDANRSLVKKGKLISNGFNLKPVVRAFMKSTTGNLSGTLSGWSNAPIIYAISGTDTMATALPDNSGNFTVHFLDPGNYSLAVTDTLGGNKNYAGPYSVTTGQTTPIGTLSK